MHCLTWTPQNKVRAPLQPSHYVVYDDSVGPPSRWSSAPPPLTSHSSKPFTPTPAFGGGAVFGGGFPSSLPDPFSPSILGGEPSSYFKEGDRVILRNEFSFDEQFNARFFANEGDQVSTGIVIFALPPKGPEEQRCVLVAHESDKSYTQVYFFRGSQLKRASEYPVYQRGDRVRLSHSAAAQGCIAGGDTYGLVVHVGDIRDSIQRNILVACVQTGAYSLYPASALLPCSSSLFISSESERESLVSELVRLNPTLGEFGISEETIKGLIAQFGSKFW